MAWKHLSFVTTLTPAVGWGECLWTLVTPVKAIMVGVGLGKNQHLFSSLVFVCLISSKFIASYPKNIFPWWHLNATQFLTEQRTSSGQEKVCFGARHMLGRFPDSAVPRSKNKRFCISERIVVVWHFMPLLTDTGLLPIKERTYRLKNILPTTVFWNPKLW